MKFPVTMAMLAAVMPLPVLAQDTVRLDASILSDYRERGLSWSDGEAAGQLYVELPIASGFSVSTQASTTRGSQRHGDADAVVDLRAVYAQESGLLRWHGGLTQRVFADGSGPLDYLEGELGLGFMIGPLDLSLLGAYAPPQEAIGGSNLHARARARFGVTGTPVTLTGHVGHSSGDVDNPLRAERLRPGGNYTDWGIGLDYALGPVVLSLAYSDTDISRRDIADPTRAGHQGATIVAGAHFSL